MTNETPVTSEVAQAEKIGLGDLVISALLAVAAFFLQQLWPFAGLHPDVWGDAAAASAVRPAAQVMPGYWIAVAESVFRVFGIDAGRQALQLLGHALLGMIAILAYALIREALTFIMRTRPQQSPRRKAVMRLAAVVGTIAFVLMDPVWTAGQCFSGTTIHLALTLSALESYFLFLRKGTLKWAYLTSVILGLLAAETTAGFFLPILLIALYLFIALRLPNLESPLFKPAVMEVGKWHMTFLFFAALFSGVAFNCWTFVRHGGIGAAGETLGMLPLAYVLGYWNELLTAADLVGWLMLIAICFAPFIVSAIRFPSAADEDQFLPYGTGLVFVFCSMLAFSQCGFLPALWFWTYFPIGSQYLLSLALFCCALTLAGGITTLGVDALCRNHVRLARQLYATDDEDSPMTASMGRSRLTLFMRRFGMIAIPVALVALMIPGRVKTSTRQMLSIVDDTVAEIVREAGDASYLFTDGTLDSAIELEAARRGHTLRCLSLIGGSDARSAYLRMRGLTANAEDRFSFGIDAGMGLRSWIRDRPERLKEAAALLGFDLWKRDGKPLPPMGGLLSRPAGFADAELREAGVSAAHELAGRVLATHALRGGIRTCPDVAVTRAFNIVQWRLARMCTYRGESYDLAGRAEEAIAEAKLAKELNEKNSTYQKMIETMEKQNEMLMQKLTAREGLQLALVRADFTMGQTYAETILGAEPDNPDANFAMGMYHLSRRQLSLAETYLKRCLIRKPNEAAVYNNLAMIQIEQKRFAAAEVNVKKALSLVPNSAAVLDTQKALEKARAAK